MKSRSKKIFVIALALMLVLQTFFDLDIFKRKIEVQGAQQLQAGDWLYLDVSGFSGWTNLGALTYVHMMGSYGVQSLPAKDLKNGLYRIKLPEGTTAFKFRRVNPAMESTASTDYTAKTTWSWYPQGDKNLEVSGAGSSNVYKITGWSSGSWTGEWKVYTKQGETIYFKNMDPNAGITNVNAVFYNSNGLLAEKQETMSATNVYGNTFQVVIPDDDDEKAYDSVRFMNGTEVLADVDLLSGQYDKDSANTYYYRRTIQNNGAVISGFDKLYDALEPINPSVLYFETDSLGIDENNPLTIKIGDTSPATVNKSTDTHGNTVFKYVIPVGTVITHQTIITVTNRGNTYHFNWEDETKNKLLLKSTGVASVDATYTEATGKYRTIYYDANFSALPYTHSKSDVWLGYEIPNKNTGKITYYATTNDESNVRKGDMTLVPVVFSENGNTYGNVYKVDLPEEYTKISFSNSDRNDFGDNVWNGDSTGKLAIPTDIVSPCFYADTSDDVVYKSAEGSVRKGYWAKLGTVRSGEYEATVKQNNPNAEVVDIPTGSFTTNDDVYYVNTTFYDYYSDYELNGLNRDNYDTVESEHRKYQQFRQFNLALSDYYSSTGAVSPIYWGNFQNYNETGSSHYSQIANTMNLYGSNEQLKFFFENNSMWGSNSLTTPLANSNNATQNLVHSTLQNGQLVYDTKSGGTAEVPYLNKEFLEGNNSKNAVLGKVYENVTFPLRKAQMKSQSKEAANGTVGYWYFNGTPRNEPNKYPTSKNLRMTKDSVSGAYYLAETNLQVNGQNALNTDMGKNFFPFNDNNQSANSSQLNYGFAMKMQFDFTLTTDGTVKTSAGEEVPIEFNFAGDDDVWIFIDGQLVLDIGGDHGIVEGRIDFSGDTPSYYISGVKNQTGGGATEKEGTFTLKGKKTDQHTLTMYYMERGLWESNLFLSFNFPDHNYLDVSKTVDTGDINSQIFGDYITEIKNADFDYEIKNYATHFPAKEASDITDDTGFIRKQYDISDYGSVAAGDLVIPYKAKYTKYTSSDSSGTEGKIDENVNGGKFQLKTGEKVSFIDQFRRGSYISLKEIIPTNYEGVFDTYWTMSENDEPVTNMGTGESVVNGIVTNLTGVHSLEVDDGRMEKYITGTEESTTIQNDGYTSAHRPTGSSFVFRSYFNPETTAKETRLQIAYTNKVKVGKLTIKKAQADGSNPLTGEYNFTVVFKNPIMGDDWSKTETFKLNVNEEKIFTGIPYGTTFTIVESTPTDGSVLESVTFSKPGVTSENLDNITNISEVVGANNDDLTYQFNNTSKPPKTTKTTVAITKIDADDPEHKLKDVEFKLEKLNTDETVDTSFTALTYTTNDDGKIETAELDSGTYQLTETKTQAGYQLLAKSIKIEIDRSAGGKTKVDGKEVDVTDDKIAITVANIKKFTLPSTGGRGRTIIVLTGIILMWISGLLYTLSQTKNRNIKKERRI